MSGLAVAAVSVLGVVFAWRLIDLSDPEWAYRVAGAVKVGVSWIHSWVPRSARHSVVFPALVCLGGIALVVGTVLPLGQRPFLVFMRHNTPLIDHGGWVLIGLAVIAAGAGYRSYRTDVRSRAPLVLGLIALGIVVWKATDPGLRTGFEVGLGGLGVGDPTRVVVPLGIGPYLAGAGAVLIVLGGWALRRSGGVCPDHPFADRRRPNRSASPA